MARILHDKSSVPGVDLTSINYRDRERLLDIEALEEMIRRGGPKSYAGSMMYHSLKGRYPKEWEAIMRGYEGDEVTDRRLYEEKKHELEVARIVLKSTQKELSGMNEWRKKGGIVDDETYLSARKDYEEASARVEVLRAELAEFKSKFSGKE